ncbi:exportin-4-like [Lycorma delicatula]|uniref:exportin-4-like n=1 Tax=Lycorma delicatula TaxID=130591 RepID=UPI003F5115AE
MMNFILSKVESNLSSYSWEPGIVKETVDFLVSLTEYGSQSKRILENKGFWQILEIYRRMEARSVPSEVKKGLYRAFVRVGAGLIDYRTRSCDALLQHWVKVLKPLQDRLQNIVCPPEKFSRTFQEETTRYEVSDVLECLIGSTQGTNIQTANSYFNFILPILNECCSLVNVYHNYQQIIELILELFYEIAHTTLCYLTESEKCKLFQCCLRIVQTYACFNTNRHSLEAAAEEDTYQDILLLMKLMTTLLPKDFIDLRPSEEDQLSNDFTIMASDVCIYGLNVIMPLMTVDLLKFPSLCLQYFKMITFLCEIYPEKICEQSPDLIESILMTVELGLKAFTVDVCILCSDFLRAFGSYLFNARQSAMPARQIFSPFLKLLMDLILSHQINSDLMPNTGITLYVLICCYPEEYRALVQGMIDSQQYPVIGERLARAFTELTSNIALNKERSQWKKFSDNFEKFLLDVQGFLLVK